MDIYMIVLRIIHIASAVFWGGTTFFFVSFLEPAVRKSGPEGGKVMQTLSAGRYPVAFPVIVLLTVVSGLLMYWRDSGGFKLVWITSSFGLGITFGAVMGLIAAAIGIAIPRSATARMAMISKEFQAQGAPPTPAQMAEMKKQSERLAQGALWTAVFLSLSMLGMSAAETLAF